MQCGLTFKQLFTARGGKNKSGQHNSRHISSFGFADTQTLKWIQGLCCFLTDGLPLLEQGWTTVLVTGRHVVLWSLGSFYHVPQNQCHHHHFSMTAKSIVPVIVIRNHNKINREEGFKVCVNRDIICVRQKKNHKQKQWCLLKKFLNITQSAVVGETTELYSLRTDSYWNRRPVTNCCLQV